MHNRYIFTFFLSFSFTFRTIVGFQSFAFENGRIRDGQMMPLSAKKILIAEVDKGTARLLADFCTSDGEIIDPYKTLRIQRSASHSEIKESYRAMMKKLHPDKQRYNRGILPGNCNNLDDVQKEFEKVKHSYEILSDKKLRAKYDRHSAIVDPGAAITRAAAEVTLSVVGALFTTSFAGIRFAGDEILKATSKVNETRNDG